MSITNEWARYRELSIAPDAGEEQVAQLHHAFFTGALSLSTLIISQLSDEPSVMTKADEDTIDDLLGELRRFCESQGAPTFD